MADLGKLIISPGASLQDALARLEEIGGQALLLVDSSGRLLRTVTDGDIRRRLLAGASLTDLLESLPEKQPLTAPPGITHSAALQIINEHEINQLVIVDGAGAPVDVLLRRELDSRILLSTPHIGDEELDFVNEAFRSNWIAPLGPQVDGFERELTEYVGGGFAAALSSGTAAIHLALRLLGIGRDDRVYASTLTFVGTVNPVMYEGSTPVFIDSEPDTWNMSPSALATALRRDARINRLPRAVIVVNLYGQSADFDPIRAACAEYDVPIIEDAAESLGATYRGHASGTLGDIGVFSFNGNKIITTSGGGALLSRDRTLIEKARFLSTQARDSSPYYLHSEIGFNYRMSNVLAAIGRGQLRVLEQRVAARRAVFARYASELRSIPFISWMPEAPFGRCTRWLSVLRLATAATDISPATLISRLSAAGIEARHVWNPMHRQPVFAGCEYYQHDEESSVADDIFAEGVCLPSGSNLSALQQDRVIAEIQSGLAVGARAE